MTNIFDAEILVGLRDYEPPGRDCLDSLVIGTLKGGTGRGGRVLSLNAHNKDLIMPTYLRKYSPLLPSPPTPLRVPMSLVGGNAEIYTGFGVLVVHKILSQTFSDVGRRCEPEYPSLA